MNKTSRQTYQVTFISFIKPLLMAMSFTIIIIVLIIYLFFSQLLSDIHFNLPTLIIGIGGLLYVGFNIIPSVLLQINYFKNDRCKQVVIDYTDQKIKVTENSKMKEINFSDIVAIEKYKTARIPVITHSYYYYYRVRIEGGDPPSLYFSCMIFQNLEDGITACPLKTHLVSFPIIDKQDPNEWYDR